MRSSRLHPLWHHIVSNGCCLSNNAEPVKVPLPLFYKGAIHLLIEHTTMTGTLACRANPRHAGSGRHLLSLVIDKVGVRLRVECGVYENDIRHDYCPAVISVISHPSPHTTVNVTLVGALGLAVDFTSKVLLAVFDRTD